MSELVLAIHRSQLSTKDSGVIPFNFEDIDPKAYALLPRHLVDCKGTNSDMADRVGMDFPQILGYFQITYDGKYLAYQRKGKEKGLFGQWSIGVGGHVSHQDVEEFVCQGSDAYPDLNQLVYAGAVRELSEEIGIDPEWFPAFNSIDDFDGAITKAIQSFSNSTSARHIGLPLELDLSEAGFTPESLELDPAEFCNFKWMTVEELKTEWNNFEDWSKWLINNM